MVSDKEISQSLRNKREGTPLNYLVCNKCGKYYELQHGESKEDFDLECECGGHLIPSPSNALFLSDGEYRDYGSDITLSYVILVFFTVLAPLMGLYLLTRDNERAKFHGKIVLVLSLGLIFIGALLIYRAYM